MVANSKKEIRNVFNRSFLNKDFDSLRAELLLNAQQFFPDRIKDFSEASVGGMFLDFAAFVGDTNSFYLDHQFNELDPETAVESKNILRQIRAAGVPITGASPAVVSVSFTIQAPAVQVGTSYVPQESALPVILEGTILEANNGTRFELIEDLDFNGKNRDGTLKTEQRVGTSNADGSPATFLLRLDGDCLSGTRSIERIIIPNAFVPFRTMSLANENITQIIDVRDSDDNVYHEVDFLSQDTVFSGILNLDDDDDLVRENLEIIPAPYRYITSTDFDTKLVTLQFGPGDARTLNDDIIPDPSDLALPLYGKKTFTRFTIDPGQLLNTDTLGVAPVNTTLAITYRHGGGLSHNVVSRTIRNIVTLLMRFTGNPSSAVASAVRASASATNAAAAAGGESAPTLDELRTRAFASRNAQSRIVTKQDLLARVYTMPSNFGRVFRAGVRSNPINPLATQLFIISRNASSQLVTSPDNLKKNLRLFLNEFRMISDAIDILDAQVVNIGVEFKIATEPEANRNIVIQDVISRLQRFFDISNFQIDQPINLSDLENIIFNNPGVVSVIDVRVLNLHGNVLEREYSNALFDVTRSTKKGLVIGPPGSIFEVRFPEFDIIGTAI